MPLVPQHPWLGKKFRDSKIKILILGESHYGVDQDQHLNFTTDLVQIHLSRKNIRFLTKVAKLVAAGEIAPSQRDIFWDDIAYTNFIGEIAAAKAREAPSTDLFKRWAPQYRETLAAIAPDVVYVCGFRLWDAMARLLPTTREGTRGAVYEVPHFISYHPSTSVDYRQWSRSFFEFLRTERQADKYSAARKVWLGDRLHRSFLN
ncbi:hypothetical protein [Thiocapsa sp. UBA6158]|uniref:hypothetical protein n=1 Tax=Thiocapsa sp. UBA6158 TaxID=1947692 RepID=UPI0025D0A949|nr:hypothetical protein [Thiocapsa sp. UBA6158]